MAVVKVPKRDEVWQVVSALVERVRMCEAEIAELKASMAGNQGASPKNRLIPNDIEFRPKRPEDFLPLGDISARSVGAHAEPKQAVAAGKNTRLEIWTDGSCDPNPGPGGWGWHRSDELFDCGGARDTTNNRMELTAIIEALKTLPQGTNVKVYSDSQYCVNGTTVWRKSWQKANWMKKGEPMLNRDLWLRLEAELSRVQVEFEWVRGHNGNRGNEIADALAEQGREIALKRGR